jgi:tetratricopeptide (TPR) repeat protein
MVRLRQDDNERSLMTESVRASRGKLRRSRAALKDAVERATSSGERAIALYQLALFHDNNSREAKAIPLYEKALAIGMPTNLKAQALAWLASSLYKTGDPKRAMMQIRRARRITKRSDLPEISRRPRGAHQTFSARSLTCGFRNTKSFDPSRRVRIVRRTEDSDARQC